MTRPAAAASVPQSATRRIAALALALAVSLAAPHPGRAQEDPFSIEGLVITASPLPRAMESVSSHVTVLDADELLSHGDRSLAEALRDVAGLTLVRSGSFGASTSLFLRGGESDYTLVLVDGVQVNRAGGGFDFSLLTTENVERVEIVRGPASALYGSDAVTGVVHIVTRTGRGAPRGTMSVQAGSYGRRDVQMGVLAGTDRAGYSLTVARRATDGVLAFNNHHVSTVLSGRARLLADDRTEVDLTLRWTDQEFHYPTTSAGVVEDLNAFTFADAGQVRATVRRAVSDRVTLEAIVGVNEMDGGTDDEQDGPADTLGFYGFTSLDAFRRVSAEARAHLSLDPATLTWGFEAERERQRSFTASASQFGPSTDRSQSERSNLAGFAHATAAAGSLAVNGGLRVEDNERFGRSASWQAGASWLALDATGTRVRGAVGTAIKEPTFFENFATGFARGNPDLSPERSRSWEVGVAQPLAADRVEVRITWFDQRFEDLIQYTAAPPSPDEPSYFNVARAASRGLEADASAALGPVTVGASHTRLDTEVLDAGFDEGAGATFVEGEALLRRPGSTSAARAAATAGGVTVSGRVLRVGRRADRDFATFPATPVTLPAYTLASVGADWTVPTGLDALAGLTLTARIDNVLDERYEEALAFRAPGRTVYVGASAALGGGGR